MPQNFQNWQALSFGAAPQNPSSQSGIPGTEFEDWANLTGPSDLIKQAAGIQRPAGANNSAAVAPPENWAEFAQQAIAPVQQKFNNLSTAASQLGEGNTFNAYKAYKGGALPAVNQPEPAVQQETSGFNFSRH